MVRVLACIACLVACGAQAEVYKWVDEKGQTQYTETPPPKDAQRLNIQAGQPSAPAEKKEAPAAPAAPGKPDAARCQLEKDQLKVFDGKVITYKNEKGETVELEESKKEAAKARIQDNIKRYCA